MFIANNEKNKTSNGMKEFKKIDLKTFASRGYNLTPMDLKDLVPFEIKRIYWITDFNEEGRTGEHCHKVEEEVFIAAQGSFVAIIDDGRRKKEVPLKGPHEAIHVPNFIWHGFVNTSPDCVIVALSSTSYGAGREDYIEDYEEFKKNSPYYTKL